MTLGLILVHGIAMHGALYETGLEAMAGPERLWSSLDLPGHGDNSTRETDSSVTDCFREAVSDLEDRGATSMVVAGESLGCSHVARLSDVFREKEIPVVGHVLFAPPMQLDGWTLMRWGGALVKPRALPKMLTGKLDFRGPLSELVSDSDWRSRLLDDPQVKNDASIVYLMRSAKKVWALGSELGRIEAPTLVLQGEHDPLMGGSNIELTLAALGSPDKEAQVVPGAGHALFWDPMTADVVEIVKDWIERTVEK